MNPTIALYPGASGGRAWTEADRMAHAEAMPDGRTAIVDGLCALAAELRGLSAVVEWKELWLAAARAIPKEAAARETESAVGDLCRDGPTGGGIMANRSRGGEA